ncbi:unnamed protein product, partial [Allacma fusca]
MFPRLLSSRLAGKSVGTSNGSVVYPSIPYRTASKFAGLKTFEEDYSETPDYP